MRKFDITKGIRGKRYDRAAYKGEIWAVVGVDGKSPYRHLYYQLRKPYKRTVAHCVRADALEAV
jgi:hypothetical protein